MELEIREDILTPKERVTRFLEGKPIDRIPCMPIVTSNTAHLIGKTLKEFHLDGEVMAQSYIAAFEKFGYDLNYLFTNCSYTAEAMGAELVYYEDEPASCDEAIIKTREDLAKIKVADKDDGKFPVFYEALDILNEEIGDQIFSAVCFSGPLSTAATLRGAESFVKDTYKDPELCHELLRMATDTCKNFVREIINHGGMPIILEPFASGRIFGPKTFEKFALPYVKEVVDLSHELNSIVPLHICGVTHKIIGKMAETGADVLSIDDCDLELAKKEVGGRAVILGRVSPADDLLFGPAEKIKKVCKEHIEIMKDYEPGYILATGCETSPKIPFDHIQVLVDAARSYGAYDYNG
ncbi:uroporphyrinogen decarboxylase family protein [Sporohalobacter salinus]|uniref:uroporphyrinogen decarboxylase family protein n=1 Tax=Sporohalobacter salinus TaxID=1494606 RepID=UPI00195F6667|nr:uroporphyrinogen decarboxylase [Sporohalobacter salinus]